MDAAPQTPPPFSTPSSSLATAPKGDDKLWSILSHLSAFLGVGIILPLIVYLVKRDESEYVARNAKEALNFHISIYLYILCCIPLVFLLLGIPLLIIIPLASLVLAIIAAVKAADGGCYHYPLTLRLVS